MTAPFTVDPSTLQAGTWTHVLRGSKAASITSMEVNGDSGQVSTPTATTWQAEVILSPGDNEFTVQGFDVVGNPSEIRTVTVNLPAYVPEIHEVMNDLTAHALYQGLSRLPGEKNIYLARRVIDAPVYPTGVHSDGLSDAISRDLGLAVQRTAMTVSINRDVYQNLVANGVHMEIGAFVILVDADEMFTEENRQVDPGSRGFLLSYEPRYEDDVEIFTRDGDKVSESVYRVHSYEKRIIFETSVFDRDWMRIKYRHRVEVSTTDTLLAVQTGLQAISVNGQQLFTVAVPDNTLPAMWLRRQARRQLRTSSNDFAWQRVQVYELHDRRFRDALLNVHGAAYGTHLQSWADNISKLSKFGWDAAILDVDTWDPLYARRNTAFLPAPGDSYRGYWACGEPSDATRYARSDYIAYSGLCPVHGRTLTYVGVRDSEWRSGVGTDHALLVTGLDAQ